MKYHYIKKMTGLGAVGLAVLAMTGCMGTKYLSEGISDAGTVQQEDIVFPELDKAWQRDGQFPNSENLSKIKSGISKDELYRLIGRPHFSEAQHAREWDYIMKFYQPDNSVKTCQYKVIFDKHYKGQEFYWKPKSCAPKQMKPVQTASPPIKERINLGADALFSFDQWRLEHMLPQGRAELDELAYKLKEYQELGYSRIIITGHTDYKGDDIYNMNLSLLRAQTVRAYLISQGVHANTMIATGAGESEPVQQCAVNLPRHQEIDCLQPNRRVTLDVLVTQ